MTGYSVAKLDEIIKRVKPSRRPSRALALWSVLIDGSGGKLSAGSELIPTDECRSGPFATTSASRLSA